MKRILILCILCGLSMSAFAQQKGDMYMSLGLGLSCGNSKTTNTTDGNSTTTKTPGAISFNIDPEFGYFIADNWQASLALSYNRTRSHIGNIESTNLYSFTNNFGITPGINYFIKLTDRFYYTPGAYLSLGFGGSSRQTDVNKTEKGAKTTRFCLGVEIAKFEFKAGERYAFTLSLGDICYRTTATKNSETNKSVSNNFYLNLDPANFGRSIGFKYYF